MKNKISQYAFFVDSKKYISFLRKNLEFNYSDIYNFFFGGKELYKVEAVVNSFLLLEKTKFQSDAESFDFSESEKSIKINVAEALVSIYLKDVTKSWVRGS